MGIEKEIGSAESFDCKEFVLIYVWPMPPDFSCLQLIDRWHKFLPVIYKYNDGL